MPPLSEFTEIPYFPRFGTRVLIKNHFSLPGGWAVTKQYIFV